MKHVLLLGCIISILSCSTPPNRFQNIEQKRAIEIKRGLRRDSIFLGFTFGMSSKQVGEKFKELVTLNKIKLNKQNIYEYAFEMDYPKNAIATFHTEFLNDSLYSLSLNFEAESHTMASLIQVNLCGLYMKKYPGVLFVPSVLNEKENDYIFIVGNQEIDIDYPFMNTTRVEYFDYSLKARKNQLEEIDKNKAKQKTLKDI